MKEKKVPTKLLNIIGILFWAYVLTKVFVYDIDNYIIRNYFPNLLWIIEWRFLIFCSLVIVLIASYGFKELLRVISFIIIIPFYFPSKKVFTFIKNNWKLLLKFTQNNFTVILVFVTNYISNLWRHFRFRFVLFYVFVLSLFIILNTSNYYVNIILGYYLLAYLFLHYFYRILTAINPSPYLDKILQLFEGSNPSPNDDYLLKVQSYEQAASLSFFVIRSKEFFQRLKTIPYLIIYFALSLIYTAILSIVILGTLHFILYKINPLNYVIATGKYYYFLVLGLDSILTVEASFIKVIGVTPNLLITLAAILKWLLTLIYGVFIVNIFKNHYNYTLAQIQNRLGKEESKIDVFLKEKFGKDINIAIKEIEGMFNNNSQNNKKSNLSNCRELIQKKEYDTALVALSELSEIQIDNSEVHYLIGYIYGEKNDYIKMNDSFEKSISINNNYFEKIKQHKEYHWSKLHNKGVEEYNSVNSVSSEAQKKEFLISSQSYLEKANIVLPNKLETLNALAYVFMLQNKYNDAISKFVIIDEIENTPRACKMILDIYLAQKNYISYNSYLKKALKKYPNDEGLMKYKLKRKRGGK